MYIIWKIVNFGHHESRQAPSLPRLGQLGTIEQKWTGN